MSRRGRGECFRYVWDGCSASEVAAMSCGSCIARFKVASSRELRLYGRREVA